tara:strand:+ start:39660 stop:40457 length:798 start_codon:yes stop_codon:yes gene_type:complete
VSGLIDTHCHLAHYHEAGTLSAILESAQQLGVSRMIAVGTSSADWSLYQGFAQQYRGQVFYSAGLHPCYVADDYPEELSRLEAFFQASDKPVALGEIGLDNYHLPEDPAAVPAMQAFQQEAFKFQLGLAKRYDCPIIIHSRHAFNECVAMIDQSGVDWNKVVFHCFAEGPEQVRILNERGGRASFTGILTYKKAEDVRQAFLAQPLELTMLETDAPYLAPVPHRGKENQPGWVSYIAEHAAQLLEMDVAAFKQKVSETSERFFEL